MANFYISNGPQTITAVGAVTGVLSTSNLFGNNYTAKVRCSVTGAGAVCAMVLQCSPSGTWSGDVVDAARFEFHGNTSGSPEGDTRSTSWYSLGTIPFGGASNAFRIFCESITAGAAASVLGWIEI